MMNQRSHIGRAELRLGAFLCASVWQFLCGERASDSRKILSLVKCLFLSEKKRGLAYWVQIDCCEFLFYLKRDRLLLVGATVNVGTASTDRSCRSVPRVRHFRD